MVVFASLSHIEHHTRGVCLFFEFHYHKNASVGLCVSYSTQYKTAVLASSVQCQHHTAIGCNQASTCRPSPRADHHVLGMLRLMPWHKPTELAHSLLVYSYVYFCLYGPFNCISFHEFSRQLSAFPLCSSGLNSALLVFSTIYLFMKVSLSPDIILCGWLSLKHQLIN